MTNDDLEKLIEELQEKVEYNEEQAYSKVVIQEYRNPSNFGVLKNPDAIGKMKGPCGDTMKITLTIENNRIKKCSFWTDGCGATIACGSMLTKMIKGKTLTNIKDINNFDILDALEGLPIEHTHCSILAINTLNQAIQKFKNK
jgi:nitrogen fixation NifU-like protein